MPAYYPLEIPRCQHIMDTGFRCASPALKGKPFCYHHHDVHANRLKLGNKGYKFRPLETSKSITMQVAEIAQAAHDGTISLQLARTLLYSVQIGAPYVSRSGGYSGDVETELTPAMATASLRNDDVSSEPCGTDIPVRHESTVRNTTVMDAGRPRPANAPCHPERGCTAEPKDPFRPHISNPAPTLSSEEPPSANPVHNDKVTAASSITNKQSPINNDPKPPQPARRIYDPVGCLSFLTSGDR